MNDALRYEQLRNAARLQRYAQRVAQHQIDYLDRDRRARAGRQLLDDINRRASRHRSLAQSTPRTP